MKLGIILAALFSVSAVSGGSTMVTPEAVPFSDHPTCVENHSFKYRKRINFNRDWRFKIGDYKGAEIPTYADKEWTPIGVPHSFSMPYFRESNFYVGYGWYRKAFEFKPEWKGKSIFIDFEGAFQVAEVYLNGKHVGTHRGGYTGFEYDLTPFLKSGSNLLAVRVNNLWDPTLAPRAGEHVFCGGIYRDVSLTVVDPLHVTWYGTRVTTPDLEENEGNRSTVVIETEVRNQGSLATTCTILNEVLSPTGEVVTQGRSDVTIPAGQTVNTKQETPAVKDPQLWSPDTPKMYQVRTTLLKGDKKVDDFLTNFGFRWFKWTADKGFFLNGKHCWIQGANAHQDHAGWGDAVANSATWRDVKQVKDAGLNFIRGSHYPHDPSLVDACDHQGILLWSECVFWGIGGHKKGNPWKESCYPPEEQYREAFEQSCHEALRDMIRIRRNHPSIVVWSMGNEPFFTSAGKETLEAINRMRDYANKLDPTRPAGTGGCQRGPFDKHADVIGYNGDGAKRHNPGRPNLVSEYGSTVSDRPGRYFNLMPRVKELNVAEDKYPWRSGEVLWCAFDHGSNCGNMGKMGFVDHFRLPKRGWYWYRNRFAGIAPPEWPVKGKASQIKLIADRMTVKTDGTEDVHLTVHLINDEGKVVDTTPDVTMSIVSGPGAFPTGRRITFKRSSNCFIIEGQAAMAFKSYFAGKTVIRAEAKGLKSAEITLNCVGKVDDNGGSFYDWPTANVIPEKFKTPESTKGWVEIAKDRPVFVSSENPEHTREGAADQNSKTYWASETGSTNEWCKFDLERFVSPKKIEIGPGPNWRLPVRVELSDDDEEWETLYVNDVYWVPTTQLTFEVDTKLKGRFLRISFMEKDKNPFTISSVKVYVEE